MIWIAPDGQNQNCNESEIEISLVDVTAMHGENVGSHHHVVVAKVRNSLVKMFKAGVERGVRGECGGHRRAGRRIGG